MITYKKIMKEENDEVKELINQVLDNLKRKEFFIPFNKKNIEDMFDETKIIMYGAYYNNKLVGLAQLFLDQSYVDHIKNIINLKCDKVAELGRYMVLKEYRGNKIMKELQSILISEAKKRKYEYIVITAHPENIPSNKTIEYSGAKIIKTTNIDGYFRNIYLLNL